MDIDDTLSSSQDSFVILDADHPGQAFDLSALDSLVHFFPSIKGGPAAFPWSYERVQQVKEQRQQRGTLFFDELLALLDVDGPTVWPPASASAFNTLLFTLLTSPYGQLRGASAIFYMVLSDSLASSTDTTPSLPTAFARNFLLPTGFVRSIEGFFHLDTGAWKAAVSALADPHLTPDFVPKTLQFLSTLPAVEERAGLILSYWRLSGVALEGKEQLAIVLGALCARERKFGVTEAWKLARTWLVEEEVAELLNGVLASCFGANAHSKPIPHHLQTLLSQPFSPAEDALVNTFCLTPPSPAISKSLTTDWRLSKLIAEGRPSDALLFWNAVKATVKPTDERARLLKAALATLTEVERNSLALEADDLSAPAPASSRLPPPPPTTSTSNLTQPAWQPVPLPAPAPLPRSLLSLGQSPVRQQAPSVSDLPLSASPFLRREKPLVSSLDGSSLGGAQKSVLRALKEGTSPAKSSNNAADKGKGKAGSYFGESPRRFPGFGGGSPATSSRALDFSTQGSLFGSPRAGSEVGGEGVRKPTLSGFGSVRQPASASYGKARDTYTGDETMIDHGESSSDEEDRLQDARMISPPPAPAPAAPSRHDSPATFSRRALQDPAIAATLAAASTPRHPSAAKRRTTSNGTTSLPAGDKRRAVSTEAEDRPSSAVRVTRPPGAFPGGFPDESSDVDHDHAEEQAERERERSRRSARKAANTSTSTESKAPVRRSARASSVQPPSTPKPVKSKRSTTTSTGAEETPKAKAPASGIRRSSRLQTPLKESVGGEEGARRKTTTTGRKSTRGRRAIEEEEGDEE